MGLEDQFDEYNQLVATIDSVASEFFMPNGFNPFIPSKTLVDLTEKYINCTNKIPISAGVYDDEFTGMIGSEWYIDIMYAKKGIALDRNIYDPLQVDSATIAELPAGLALNMETGIVSGTVNIEMAESKFEVFNTTLTMTRGDKTLEVPFQIIYLDMSVITEEFTLEDYSSLLSDSNLILQLGTCSRCPPPLGPGGTFPCGGATTRCRACELCDDGKTSVQYCLTPAEPCP
jgi:hypothetical protein